MVCAEYMKYGLILSGSLTLQLESRGFTANTSLAQFLKQLCEYAEELELNPFRAVVLFLLLPATFSLPYLLCLRVGILCEQEMEDRGDIFHFSWVNKEYRGAICVSKVRDQKHVGLGSCSHHSVGAVLEMLYRTSAGLSSLSSTKNFLEWLKDNDARAEGNGREVFKLKNFEEVRPLDDIGGVPCLLQKLFKCGPFVGVFAIKADHRRGVQDIYLCDGTPVRYYGSTSTRIERRLRHAVAVVGFGIDKDFHPFWEHLESNSPEFSTFQGRGVRRVLVTGIDRVFVLDV
ncbi:hypothetical protein ACET3Z_018145 [Daucus carota]